VWDIRVDPRDNGALPASILSPEKRNPGNIADRISPFPPAGPLTSASDGSTWTNASIIELNVPVVRYYSRSVDHLQIFACD